MRNPFLSDWWSGRRRGLKLLRVFKDFKDFRVIRDLRVFRVVEVLGFFLPPGVPSPVGLIPPPFGGGSGGGPLYASMFA